LTFSASSVDLPHHVDDFKQPGRQKVNKFSEKLVADFVKRHKAQRARYLESIKALKATYLSDFEKKVVRRFVANHEANHERYLKILRTGKPYGKAQLFWAVGVTTKS